MRKLLELVLGVMTALGGFVDVGELVFCAQAGARFGYSLLWVIVLGTVGIILYSEMCGRVAAVGRMPVFYLIRRRMGRRLGMVVLVASTLLTVATCAAEVGAIAVVLRLLSGFGPGWMPLAVVAVLIALVLVLPFRWIERVFGLAGLTMAVFFVAYVAVGPDWASAGKSLAPNLPDLHGHGWILYAYFAAGILSSVVMPYEVYFYSSGGIEENWTVDDLPMNRVNTILGFSLGSLVAMAIVGLGAEVFGPRGIVPETIGSAALLVGTPLGRAGVVLALIGILTAVAGAAVETAMAAAYNLCQYAGKPWGRARSPRETPHFDGAWIAVFVIAALIMITGVDPVVVVEIAVMLAVVCLPLTYLPILLTARDRGVMGKHANGPITNGLGWAYLALIIVAAIAAPILLVATDMGAY